MREFAKVTPQTWREKKFRGLASSDAKLLLLYAQTCEHQTSAGVCRLPALYACSDLDWSTDRFEQALSDVVAAGLIVRDGGTEELFCVGWFSGNRVVNQSHRQFVERRISEIESDAVRDVIEVEFLQSQEELAARRPRKADNVHSIDPLLNTPHMRRGA